MLTKLKILKFWIIALSVLAWNTLKGNHWNMAYVDFHIGNELAGRAIRKQLIAKRSGSGSLEIYWQ